MNASPHIKQYDVPPEGKDLSLWLAVLGAPFLFLCHLQLNYALARWACTAGKQWPLHLVSAAFLLLLIGSGVVSALDLRRAGGTSTEPNVQVPVARHRALAALGIMLAGLFFLVVLAQAIATFLIGPCPE
jgi:hypothetical protein